MVTTSEKYDQDANTLLGGLDEGAQVCAILSVAAAIREQTEFLSGVEKRKWESTTNFANLPVVDSPA